MNPYAPCPVWLGPVPCCLPRLHNGQHLPTLTPRSLPPVDDAELVACQQRHPAGRAAR